MGILDQLPTELLLQICLALCRNMGEVGQANLSRLSRTCRRLRDLAQPLVFTAVNRNGITHAYQIKLIRALEMRPDLARNLKCIIIGLSSDYEPDISPDDCAYIQSLLAKFKLPAPISARWDKEKMGGPARLFLTELILLHTPHLTHLELPMNPEWELPILSHFADHNAPPPTPLLPRLSILQLSHYYSSGDRWDIPFREFVSVCAAAPSLEELWTYNPGSEGGAKYPYPLGNLRRLEFEDVCGMDEGLLFNMLASIEQLEVFGLLWHPSGDSYNWTGEGTAADAWKALVLQKESLKEIRLDILRGEGDYVMEVGRLKWYTLDRFEKLEVLKVGEFALQVLREKWRSRQPVPPANDDGFLEGLFPKTIREVTFWEPDGGLVGSMPRFAAAVAQGECPDLKRVVIAPPENMSDRWFPGWLGQSEWVGASGDLHRAFARSGVVFEVQTERADGIRGPFWGGGPSVF